MSISRFLPLLLVCFLMVSCGSDIEVSESSILPGMTIAEVKTQFGEPSFEMNPAEITTLTYGQTVIVFDSSGKAVAVNDKLLEVE